MAAKGAAGRQAEQEQWAGSSPRSRSGGFGTDRLEVAHTSPGVGTPLLVSEPARRMSTCGTGRRAGSRVPDSAPGRPLLVRCGQPNSRRARFQRPLGQAAAPTDNAYVNIRIPKLVVVVLGLLLAAAIGAAAALAFIDGSQASAPAAAHSPGKPATAPPVRLLSDCRRAVVPPTTVTLACGDAGLEAQHLAWQDLGREAGRGWRHRARSHL